MQDLSHTRLIDRACAAPDSEVFRMPGQAITYAAFADKAARLARTLTEIGVKRGDRVGLYLPKSIESAIALYAIFQAGAAYVPLDPAAPGPRIAHVIAQCGARVLVTEATCLAKLPAETVARLDAVIGPDAVGTGAATQGARTIPLAEALAAPTAPATVAGAARADLAYIIFTSGSTGAPKGIMHSHGSSLAYTDMAATLYGVGPGDRLTGISPLHFDMSTFDYLCGPQRGARTTIVPDAYLKLPASLAELAAEDRITIWYSVPFALTQMLLYGAMEEVDLGALRWVLFGGEPFPPKHLAALTRALPGARFSNVYGPAEVNQCTFHHLPATWDAAAGQPPIGTPCPGVSTQVVDADLVPVPTGEVGELLVEAPTTMRGYWGRADLTARTLLARKDPETGEVRVWLRTGDLAQVGADGTLAFRGRADRMAKIRGYRIELDEVEDVLASHPAVEEAAAFAVTPDEGPATLGAAVTLQPGTAPSASDLRDHVAARLPPYAVPAQIDVLQVFPRTGSGKIDWRALGLAASGQQVLRGSMV